MKYFAAALIGMALCAWGLYKAAGLRRRTECLERIRIMIEKCGGIIERKGCDAAGVLLELSGYPLMLPFSFITLAYEKMLSGLSFADAFFLSSEHTGELDSLNSEDRELLTEYIYAFSSVSRETLLNKSRDYVRIFENRASDSWDYSRKNGRLYMACGMLSAAVVIIFVI